MKIFQIASCLLFIAQPVFAGPAAINTTKDALPIREWMHHMCCPERDCRVADIGEVSQTPDGFSIAGFQAVVRFDDVRLRASYDNDTHICSVEVPPIEIPDGGDYVEIKCLYVPLGS